MRFDRQTKNKITVKKIYARFKATQSCTGMFNIYSLKNLKKNYRCVMKSCISYKIFVFIYKKKRKNDYIFTLALISVTPVGSRYCKIA